MDTDLKSSSASDTRNDEEIILRNSSLSGRLDEPMRTLHGALSQMYFLSHMHRPPSFVQVVGWTATAELPETQQKHVYVRKVPLKVYNSPNGGRWEFDYDVIKEYAAEVEDSGSFASLMRNRSAISIKDETFPMRKPALGISTGVIITGGDFLRFDGFNLERADLTILQPSQRSVKLI